MRLCGKNTVERDRPQMTLWRIRIGCGTKYRFDLQGSINPKRPLKMESIGCNETSVTNYHHTLSNIPEECSLICMMFGLKMTFPTSYARPKAPFLTLLRTISSLRQLKGLSLLFVLVYRNFTLYTAVLLGLCYCCIHFQKTHENIISAVSALE